MADLISPQVLKGFRDSLPQQELPKKELMKRLETVFESFGFVPIDTPALEIVHSFIGRMLDNIPAVSRILDADTVVVGMRPAVAITLVELGLSLPGIRTALNVELGMELLTRAPDAPDDGDPWGDDPAVPAP